MSSNSSGSDFNPHNFNNNGRKRSFYRRVSVHHFHVLKDQMACCCCVPLGMAYHIIASLDVVISIFMVIQALEFKYAADEDLRAQNSKSIYDFYQHVYLAFAAIVALYSMPRLPMYLMTLCRAKSYGRLKLYFRTRIVTMLILMVIQFALFLSVVFDSEQLAVDYDSTESWILF